MVNVDILKGIVFSCFGDKGPEAKYWFPISLDQDMLLKISVKTITLLAGDSGEATNQIAFIQFPEDHLSTFVYLFGIPNENARGKKVAASISLLIVDKYNSIFYFNMNELENSIKEISEKIIANEVNNKSSKKLLVEFYYDLKEKVQIYTQHRITTFKIKDDSEELPFKDFKEFNYKIALVGAPGVGKTSLLLRFTEEAFRDRYIATNVANVNIKTLDLMDEKIRIHFYLWDISGQVCYIDMNEKLINGCDAIIYVYDITRFDTFNEVKYWYDWINDNIGYKIGVLVGNKLDLKRKVSKENAKNLAKHLKLGYLETSSKNGTNVNLLFENIAKAILKLYRSS
ncbi:MAG: GTP-binding protein [Candidatus Helarchaeota archaeon]